MSNSASEHPDSEHPEHSNRHELEESEATSTSPGVGDPLSTPTLKASVRDGSAHAAMLGFGENYLGVFGIFLHATPLQVAIMASLPQAIGAVSQWFSLALLNITNNRKKIILYAASVNAALWVPIAALAFFSATLREAAVPILIALAALYFSSAGFAAPIWNSLIGDLVPPEKRGTFFGVRNRRITITTFIAVIIAGKILHYTDSTDQAAIGFAVIFCCAGIARMLSVYFLNQHVEPHYVHDKREFFSMWDFLRRSLRSNYARFVYFVSAINGAVAFSAPFFALYMLRDLNFSYGEFTIVTGFGVLSQFAAMRYWGTLVDLFGTKKILNVCGVGVGIAPFLWLVSANFYWILGAQLVIGIVWAGFALASASFIFDAVTPAKRARCAAYQGVVNGIVVLIAAFSGGMVASVLPSSFSIFGLDLALRSNLLLVFALSGTFRLIAAFFILPRFHEVREVKQITHKELIFRMAQIMPLAGITLGIVSGREKRGRRDPEICKRYHRKRKSRVNYS